MASRLQLHEELCVLLGTRNVYFDPPASVTMRYPAIRYSRKQIDKLYANNSAYKMLTPYELILIDKDPDSGYVDKILQLPYCSHDRHYVADNLHHDTFTIYY